MDTIDRPRGDLRALTRDATDSAPPPLPKPKFPWVTRVLVPGGVLVALLLLLGYSARDMIFPPRAVRVVPVVLKAGGDVVAGSGGGGNAPAGVTVQAPGWVEADPYAIGVSALVDGIVEEVLVLEGDQVKAGQVVARLVSDEARIMLARGVAELEHHRADLQAARAALKAAQDEWDNPIERDRAVAMADALAAETRAELARLPAEIRMEQAKADEQRDQVERFEEAVKVRATSDFELSQAKFRLRGQEAAVEAAQRRKDVLEAKLRQQEAELTAAKENLRLRIAETKALEEAKAAVLVAEAVVREAQADRDNMKLRLDRMEVRSAADGVVMLRLAEPGSRVMMLSDMPHSTQVVRLYDPRKLQVRVDVPLADAAKVGVGMDARIVVGVLPERTFNGKVTRIVNEADIQKNTLQVKVAITDPSTELKPEMLARVRFIGNAHNAAGTTMPSQAGAGGSMTVFAPAQLVHRHAGGGGEASVWVVDPRRSVAVHKSVVVGHTQLDGWIGVASGLSAGDQLIVDHEGLSDGQRIRVAGEADPSNLKAEEAGHGTH